MTGNGQIPLATIAGESGIFADGDWIETKDQDANGDVRLIQMMDVGDGHYLNKSSRFLTSSTAKELRCTFLREGDVLISRMPDPLGRACIFPGDDRPCVTAVDVCIARPDPKIVDNRWLKYRINSPEFRSQIYRWTTGTTRSRISRGNLGRITMSLPPLEEQKRIAAILDKADAIRRKRQDQLQELQTFIEATYFKMFGHPEVNSHGWDLVPFAEVCESRLGKMLDAKQQTGAHARFYLRNLNVQWCRLDLTEMVKMDFNAADRKEFKLQYGDVLICEGGAGVGQTAIWRDELPECYFQKSLHRVRPQDGKAVPEYIQYLMWALMQGSSLLNSISTATIPHLTGIRLKSVKIPVPPIEVQERFQKIVLKHEEMREHLEQAVRIDNDLFNSLVQRAFKGEL